MYLMILTIVIVWFIFWITNIIRVYKINKYIALMISVYISLYKTLHLISNISKLITIYNFNNMQY